MTIIWRILIPVVVAFLILPWMTPLYRLMFKLGNIYIFFVMSLF